MVNKVEDSPPARVRIAAKRLANARRAKISLKELMADCRPMSMQEGLAVQDAVTDILGERIRGWKVHIFDGGEIARGAILQSLFFEGDCEIDASLVPFLGIEAEIAFRLNADLPKRAAPYARDEVANLVSACPAIEVIQSRYIDFSAVTLFERVADHFLNGAFVQGPTKDDWQSLDLSTAHLTLEVNGIPVIDSVGGHTSGDPILPLVDLANHFRSGRGLKAGEVITTGSLSGLICVKPDQTVKVTFDALGSVQARFGTMMV